MDVSATFYFDLGSPESYLAAERALRVLPGPCVWQPILANTLRHYDGHDGYRCESDMLAARERVEVRAQELGLLPVVWPAPFPYDSEFAMLTATFAQRIGKAVPFALAAFRQAFAGGNALSVVDNVLIAAAACEMHPNAVLHAARTKGVADELARASARARELGVGDVPAVAIGADVLVGEARLEEAGAMLRGAYA
jgi:2-hydroxychromene-2-carboxylate isomerase